MILIKILVYACVLFFVSLFTFGYLTNDTRRAPKLGVPTRIKLTPRLPKREFTKYGKIGR